MTFAIAKLAIRLVAFGLVFWFATRRNPKITIKPRYALPLVALVFAVLNIGVYWLARPLLDLATFRSFTFVVPFFLNGLFLYATDRVLRPLKIEGLWPLVWLSGLLTIMHGILYVALEYLPGKF